MENHLDPLTPLELVKRYVRPVLPTPEYTIGMSNVSWTGRLTQSLQRSNGAFKRKQRKAFRAISSGEPYMQALIALSVLNHKRSELAELGGAPPERILEFATVSVLAETHQISHDSATEIVNVAEACLREPVLKELEARFELVSKCVSGVPVLQRDLYADMRVNISYTGALMEQQIFAKGMYENTDWGQPPPRTKPDSNVFSVQPVSQLAPPPSRASPPSLDSSLPPPFAANTPTAVSSGMGSGDNTKPWISELRELGTLRDDGILNEAEFQAEKERIMKARRQQ